MSSRRLWFKLILAGMLAVFVTTSFVPALSPPAYAQGVFGNKRSGSDSSQDDEAKKKAEQEAREKAEREQQAREQAERDRQAREQAERDRQAREQTERDRQAREQAERDRQGREQAERERREREQAERDRQAREQAERERQTREQAERERQAQAQEQAERDRQAREQAERDRQAREQAERDRQARERAEREKPTEQPTSVLNKSGSNSNERVHQPTPPETENRRGDKFTRIEERPRREERRESRTYRPPDYYPYDPGYRHDAPVYIPVPEPVPVPVPVPTSPTEEPEVIVIDRGPDAHPEPEPPKQEEDVPIYPEPIPESKLEPAPEEQPEIEPAPLPKRNKPQRYAQRPAIPQDLKRPARRGSAQEALNHISLGWLHGDAWLIRKHVRAQYPVRIYQKGRYLHKISGSEFMELTADGLKRMNTREFRLYPISTKNSKVYARGTHVYVGQDGRIHRAALNYTLKKISGVWTIVEVGYSPGTVVEAKAK